MATGADARNEEVISFDLFNNLIGLGEEGEFVEVDEDDRAEIEQTLDMLNASEPIQKDKEYEAFEQTNANNRFPKMSSEDLDNLASENHAQATNWQTTWAVKVFKDWLGESNLDPVFENLPDEMLANYLRNFFGAVRTKDGTQYSQSSMINLRSGLNRYLQGPPNNRIVNLMRNDIFQNANKVFKGKIRKNKKDGLDVSKIIPAIEKQDVEKLYSNYFIPGLSAGNTEVLLHKVFFDIVYFTGRRGKEGLRALKKNSFELKITPEGRQYLEISFNEVTKKNQGDNTSTKARLLHNNHHIISEQTGDVKCPVNSYIHYKNLLHPDLDDFFQRPNKKRNGFDKMAIGKETIAEFMKKISNKAGLSQVYTNHCIRHTTATAMKRCGRSLKEIQDVTKQVNMQSLQRYIDQPTLEEKEKYNDDLFSYTVKNPKKPKNDIQEEKQASVCQEAGVVAPVSVQIQPNVPPEDAVIPFEPDLKMNVPNGTLTTNNMVNSTTNQLRQAPVLFQGATFNNCTINLNVPQ